jgi:hypothetical protein
MELKEAVMEKMDRIRFERLRDLPGKTIDIDIHLLPKRDRAGVFVMEDIPINNSEGVDARLKVEWIEETDAKCINVHIKGIGPICRLEVDSKDHAQFGRSHKHALREPTCPENNLPRDITNRDELSGKEVQEIFLVFCVMAKIDYQGKPISIGS